MAFIAIRPGNHLVGGDTPLCVYGREFWFVRGKAYTRKNGAKSELLTWRTVCRACDKTHEFQTGCVIPVMHTYCVKCFRDGVKKGFDTQPVQEPSTEEIVEAVVRLGGRQVALGGRCKVYYLPVVLLRVSPGLGEYLPAAIVRAAKRDLAAGSIAWADIGLNRHRNRVKTLVPAVGVFA